MPDPAFTVAITGSRGLIGSELVAFLTGRGYSVVRLATGKGGLPAGGGTRWVNWNPAERLPPGTFDGVDALVHLAGENIAKGRWSEAKKRTIRDSRTGPTRLLAETIALARPSVFVCASAVGYYGSRGDEVLTEESPPGDGFFPTVCREWEAATRPARDAGIRTVNTRFSIVLSAKGGALGKQLLPFKIGLGAILGSGKQWVPWITIHDTVRAIEHCLKSGSVEGPVNVAAPGPVSNREFARTLGRVLRRPVFLRVPRFALRLVFGELADEGLLASLRVVPRKLLDTGFAFEHTELTGALRSVLGRS